MTDDQEEHSYINQIDDTVTRATPTTTVLEQVSGMNVMLLTDTDGMWQDVLNDTMTHHTMARDMFLLHYQQKT